jgi:hypothetical protein
MLLHKVQYPLQANDDQLTNQLTSLIVQILTMLFDNINIAVRGFVYCYITRPIQGTQRHILTPQTMKCTKRGQNL